MNMSSPEVVDILLVEDNARDAELTIRALKKRNLANNLYLVSDGVQALDFVFQRGKYANNQRQIPLRVVLLDLKLPKLGGLEVLKSIKSDERTRTIPVVILTSSRQDPDIKSAYELGANSYIVKPVDFDGFTEAMSHIGFYWLLVNQSLK
jgi:two-component system, response regulator